MGTAVVAVAVGVVLADSSIVTLALPDVLRAFDADVGDVAWVLISFNLVLALVTLPAAAFVQRRGARSAWRAGLVVFAAASLVCALAPSLWVLVAARCAQAAGGAAVLTAALELLIAGVDARRAIGVWSAAGIFGAAVGPALGGALTELLSWQAIFAVQVPLVLLAAGGNSNPVPARRHLLDEAPPVGIWAALALVSAALTAALFLLVVMLIEGWRLSPAQAGGVVSIMPVTALLTAPLGRRLGGLGVRAAAGTIALGGGLAALGLLPGADVAWTVAPQVLIGLGLGLSLAALTEGALRGSGPVAPRAAWTMSARHGGVVLGLALLTPIFTAGLDEQNLAAQRAGSALLLDARLAPALKIRLGSRLAHRVTRADGRLPNLGPAFQGLDEERGERGPLARLQARLTDEIMRAATHAFSRSFLAGSGLALLALVPLLLFRRRKRR